MLTLTFQNGNSINSAVAINLAFANGVGSRCLVIRCDGISTSKLELLTELSQSSEIIIAHSPNRSEGSEQCLQSAVRMLKEERIELWSAINDPGRGTADRDQSSPLRRKMVSEAIIGKMRFSVNGKEKFSIDSFDRYEQVGIIATLRSGTQDTMIIAHGLLRDPRREVVWLQESMANEVELAIRVDRAIAP